MNIRDTLDRLASWPSLQAFYGGDDRRATSGESDFGCWWLSGNLGRTVYRVSAVKDTGEIYIIRLSQGLHDEHPGVIYLAGRFTPGDYTDAESTLDGWADVCGSSDSLNWALERLVPTLERSPVPTPDADASTQIIRDVVTHVTLVERCSSTLSILAVAAQAVTELSQNHEGIESEFFSALTGLGQTIEALEGIVMAHSRLLATKHNLGDPDA